MVETSPMPWQFIKWKNLEYEEALYRRPTKGRQFRETGAHSY